MLTTGILLFALAAQQQPQTLSQNQQTQTVKSIDQSGRCATVAETPDERVAAPKRLPPGKPPLLSFRLYETRAHHGGTSGLMLDDAGH